MTLLDATAPIVVTRRSPPRAATPRTSFPVRFRAETVVFLGLLALYLVVGFWLVLAQHSIMEDALSRVSNADYVLYSREPKLANVGFVWTPLPSLLFLPLLPLKFLWPPLVDQGLLANIVSAVAMAASATVLCGLLADLRVSRRVRIALAVAFGLQPMIIWFGANGMTEALLIVFVLVTGRKLLHWSTSPDADPRSLMAAGGFLALGYLARYEVLAAGSAAVVAVAALTWWRTPGERRQRREAALADALLVGGPLVATFTLWALASWIIVGHPFDQFSSAYGNSALVDLVDAGGAPVARNPLLPSIQWLILAPVLPVVAAMALYLSVRRRDLSLLMPVGLLAAVLGFESLVYLAGSLFGFLRYQIVVIPMLVILTGYLFRGDQRAPDLPRQGSAPDTPTVPTPPVPPVAAVRHDRPRTGDRAPQQPDREQHRALPVTLAATVARGLRWSLTTDSAVIRPKSTRRHTPVSRPAEVSRPVRARRHGRLIVATVARGLRWSLTTDSAVIRPRSARRHTPVSRPAVASRPGWARGRSGLTVAAAVAVLIPGLVLSGDVFMTKPQFANQEWGRIRPAVLSVTGSTAPVDGSENGLFDVDREIAANLDARRLPPGSVVVDSGSGFAVLAATANMRQFVITSDQDFAGAVIDPVGHHVRYLLLNTGKSQFDAIAAAWPDLTQGRPGKATWAHLDTVFPSQGQSGAHNWTLWRVDPTP